MGIHFERAGPKFEWTDEAIEILTRLCAEGKSSREIGAVLGCSRLSVIGKASRCKIALGQARDASYGAPRAPDPPARPKRAPPGFAPKKVSKAVVPTTAFACAEIRKAGRLGVGDAHAALRARDCRWPIGEVDADDFHFCSRLARLGLPYCDDHTAKAKRER